MSHNSRDGWKLILWFVLFLLALLICILLISGVFIASTPTLKVGELKKGEHFRQVNTYTTCCEP